MNELSDMVNKHLSTVEAINQLLIISDEPRPCDLLFIPGSDQLNLADKASELFLQGMAPRIMIAGRSHRPLEAGEISESEQLKNRCLELGVPEHAILTENESTNTLENITFSAALIKEKIGWNHVKSVLFVCKNFHSRRLLMTAQAHWPTGTQLLFSVVDAYRNGVTVTPENWPTDSAARKRIFGELERIIAYTEQGDLTLLP